MTLVILGVEVQLARWSPDLPDEVSREVARDRGAVYVDLAGETGPTMRSDTDRYFARDRYHPSDDGYALWADTVVEQLEPALVEREGEHADR